MRRSVRVALAGTTAVLTLTGLAGCRTDPSVAAYVGGDQVTVGELQAEIDRHLQDKTIAAYAQRDESAFTRQVLKLMVEEEVYADAADHYDVHVGDDAVRARIAELIGDNAPEDVYGQLAQQGISRHDVFENVRQQLVRQQVAQAEGKATGLTEAELRARYAQVRESLKKVRLGYITVPDQATADAVLAQLQAQPGAYAALAGRYAGPYTLPSVEERSPDQVPSPLADQVAGARPGTGFAVPVPETGGVVVAFVAGVVYPTFEEVRGSLESEAGDKADAAGATLVDTVRKHLRVRYNPRYDEPADSGVVKILPSSGGGSAAAAGGAGGQSGN